jgi:hypothetical protein
MSNAQQPTHCTRHMDIKHFSLLDWVERDLVILKKISTSDNAADAFTKPLSKQLFYRHLDTYMGYRLPKHLSKLLAKQNSKKYLPLSFQQAEKMGGGGGGIGTTCR